MLIPIVYNGEFAAIVEWQNLPNVGEKVTFKPKDIDSATLTGLLLINGRFVVKNIAELIIIHDGIRKKYQAVYVVKPNIKEKMT